MSGSLKLLIVLVMMFIVVLFPPRVNALTAVTVTPSDQSVPQGGQASYTVSAGTGSAGPFQWSLSGEPVSWSFSPNPSSCPAAGCLTSSNLMITASDIPGDYCPGSYPFTVTVTNTGPVFPGASSSGTGELDVTPVGPPLAVSVSTDKSSYIDGDTITITVTVNKPAEGTITVSPSGQTFPFSTLSAQTVTETLTASKSYGTYTVSVSADDYCGTEQSPTTTFSIGPSTYSASIQLAGLPAQYSAPLLANGQNQTVPGSQTETVSFPIGTTNTVTVGQYVSGPPGVRYYCAQNTLSVSSAGSYTFSYQTQYQFNLATNPPGVTQLSGGGWIDAGGSAQTSQAPQTIPGTTTGVQYAFQGWNLDGANQTGNQITVIMNGPHTAVADYATQYLLTVNSPGGLGSPEGGGYYDARSTAQFSVTSPEGYLIQQVFVQWQGDYTGTSPQGSVTMDSPKTVTATWTTSYTNLYIAGGVVAAIVVIATVLGISRRGKGKGIVKETKKEEEKGKEEKKRGLHLGDSSEE